MTRALRSKIASVLLLQTLDYNPFLETRAFMAAAEWQCISLEDEGSMLQLRWQCITSGSVRCMQVYIAAQGAGAVKVYELWYGNSMEQHRFQAGVAREQRAFEELIRAKGAMVLPDLAQVRGTWLPSDCTR